MQQYWVKIISVLKNCMNSREIQNVDTYINEITEEHLFLRIYEKNSKELSALNIIINTVCLNSHFGFRIILSGTSKKCG